MECGVELHQLVKVRTLSLITILSQCVSPVHAVSAVTCPVLTNPTNGQVSMDTNTVGSTATYICSPGYDVNGATTVTCGADGSWSPVPTTCDGEKLLTLLNPLFISLCV